LQYEGKQSVVKLFSPLYRI